MDPTTMGETMTTPSNFIWYERMTSDPAGAARFYGAVVGWTIAADRDPAAGDVDYRMIVRGDGGNAGGVLALNADMLAGGARPAWMGYLEVADVDAAVAAIEADGGAVHMRSEEHTSELQSLMRSSYAVFCLTKKKKRRHTDKEIKRTT